MPSGLFALLDDVATIAKVAAASIDDVGAAASKAGVKAAGVVVDDTAVTPRYVTGFTPDRELPIIWRITKGSLFNKLVLILPALLLLSTFLPWAITPLLMMGGAYLCFEGAEKVIHALQKDKTSLAEDAEIVADKDHEETMVKGAVRTDLILSAEIMVIALNEVLDEHFAMRAATLAVVAIVITVAVYGVVGLIVKMDDIGLHLAERPNGGVRVLGRGLVKGMPVVMSALSIIGTAAMLWVGGHILFVGADELGWHWPYSLVHDAEHAVQDIANIGGVLSWLTNTAISAAIGLVWGVILIALAAMRRSEVGSSRSGPGRTTGEPKMADMAGTHSGTVVEVNGMSMYYEECGEGPPVVLMHGGMGSSLRMRPAAEILSSRYRVITPDSRAHGRSNNPSGELSYAVMADDIAALIELLDLDRPFVGGWSDGGQVALEIGMRYPDLSRGLIVAGAYYALPGQLVDTIWGMGFEGQGVLNTEVFEGSLDVYGGGDYLKALHPQGPGYHQTLAMQVTHLWLNDHDYQLDDLAKITAPTLVLLGDRDEPIPVEQAFHMYNHISAAELAVVPATGHDLPYTKTELFTRILLAFFDQHVDTVADQS